MRLVSLAWSMGAAGRLRARRDGRQRRPVRAPAPVGRLDGCCDALQVFIRAVETGVPLEAMTVMAIISALNDAAHPRLAEGVFACAFASALDLQPLLTLAWPEDQWASPGVRGNSPLAPEQGADHGPYSLADRGALCRVLEPAGRMLQSAASAMVQMT